jgi:hypothetical protein
MRIANAYPDPLIGCTMFPEDAETDEFGFGLDVATKVAGKSAGVASGLDDPRSTAGVGSGLDAPEPPPLDPNNPADSLKVRSGL